MRYCYKLRKQALERAEALGNVAEAAREFGIAPKTIFAWRQQSEEELRQYQKPGRKQNTKIDEEKLREAIGDGTDIMQKELARQFNVSPSGMCRALKRLKISRKKNVDIR